VRHHRAPPPGRHRHTEPAATLQEQHLLQHHEPAAADRVATHGIGPQTGRQRGHELDAQRLALGARQGLQEAQRVTRTVAGGGRRAG
jgi:hypothetical protein